MARIKLGTQKKGEAVTLLEPFLGPAYMRPHTMTASDTLPVDYGGLVVR